MTEFYKLHKKKIIVISFLFLLFFGGYWNLRYNLPKTIEFITGIVLGAKIKSSDIVFEKNKILVKDFALEDKKDTIISAPEVEILYSKESLKKFRVEEIIVDGGQATIVREKNGDINVVAAFVGRSIDKPEDKKKEKKSDEKYNPGMPVPIDRITAKNVTTTFRDESFGAVIEEVIYNTNGFITFSSTKGMELHFAGNNGDQLFDYSFNNYKEPFSMTIKLSNIIVNPTLIQYGYTGEEISCDKGLLNMDLTISSSALLGWINFKGVELKYRDLNDIIRDINGTVDFNEKGIFLKANGLVFGKREDFNLKYQDEELDMGFDLKNISQKDVEKLSYLANVKLPFKDAIVDNVKFNLNMKKELKVTIDADVKNLDMNNLGLKNTSVNFVYDSQGLHLKNLNSTLIYFDEKKQSSIVEQIKGNFTLDKDKGKLLFNIKNTNDKKYIPDVVGTLNFELKKESVDFKFVSNILSLKGKYFTKEEKLILDSEKEYFLEYNLKEKKFVKGNGRFIINLLKNKFLIDYFGKNNIITINKLSISNELGNTENFISGKIDLNTNSYDFDILGEEFKLQSFYSDKKDILSQGKIKGKILSNNGILSLNLDFFNFSVNHFAKVENINGNLKLNNKNKVDLEFTGEIGSIEYEKYSAQGMLAIFRLKNNKFEIRSFDNEYITINGIVDLNKNQLDIFADAKNLPLSKFDVFNPEITVKNLNAKFYGALSNPKGEINPEILVEINDGVPITINGKVFFDNEKFYTNNLKINNNVLKAEYSLKNGDYWLKGNIIQEDIGKYYGDNSLKYRVIGRIDIKGNQKNITSSIKSTIDKIYIQGKNLPNIYLDATYNSTELIDGILRVNEFAFTNSKLENLVQLSGNVDLKSKTLDFKINRQDLSLKSLDEYIPVKDIEGEIDLTGGISGTFDDIQYKLNLYCDKITAKKVEINKIKMNLFGDLNQVTLSEFSFRYLNNLFITDGMYNIKDGSYDLVVKSDKINLSFLNIFLNKYKVENINGIASFNIELTKDRNSGFLKISNFGLEKKDLFLKLDDFNSTILLSKNKLYTENLTGKFNKGDVVFNGSITLPTLDEISGNPYFYEELQYQANLELKNIFYQYENYFNLLVNTNLNIKNNSLFGQIEIVNGNIYEIPTKHEGIFEKIKKFLFGSASKTVNDSEILGKDFKIETTFENAFNVNVGVKIKDGINIQIDEVVSLVTDVEGNIMGSGLITGNKGKYLFLGNLELMNGSFNVNDNLFNLDRVLVAFNDKNVYFPKINPTILVDASVQVQNDTIDLSLNGTLDNLRFNISSDNGNSSGSLNALLTGNNEGEGSNDITATLLTNIIGGQFTQILKPISNLVKHTLGLSKFRIASNIITEDQSKNDFGNNNRQQSKFRLGAVLEAEDNLYKDKIWWVAKATLLGDDSEQNNTEGNNSNNGGIKDYDFSVEYRFDNTKSIGIGIGQLPPDMQRNPDKDTQKKLNYHIDFKFQKKYDNLLDIFINK